MFSPNSEVGPLQSWLQSGDLRLRTFPLGLRHCSYEKILNQRGQLMTGLVGVRGQSAGLHWTAGRAEQISAAKPNAKRLLPSPGRLWQTAAGLLSKNWYVPAPATIPHYQGGRPGDYKPIGHLSPVSSWTGTMGSISRLCTRFMTYSQGTQPPAATKPGGIQYAFLPHSMLRPVCLEGNFSYSWKPRLGFLPPFMAGKR